MRALVLGGGRFQAGLIRRLREKGIWSIVADISDGCPGKTLADQFIRVDTNDALALQKIGQEYHVDLVMTDQTDRLVPVAAYVSQQLGLKGLGLDLAHRFTDKHEMLRRLKELGAPIPDFKEVSSQDEALSWAKQNGFPVIFKPKQSQSAVGVVRVDDDRELKQAFESTMAESKDGKILAEEFVEGMEISVEGFSLNGKYHLLAVGEKEHYPENHCVTSRIAYPPRFDAELMEIIRANAALVVEGLGLQDGLSHGEYILRDRTPWFLEVAARGGGNHIADLILPHTSGVDVYGATIDLAMGKAVTIPNILRRAAVLEWFDFRPGTVAAIHGIDQVTNEGLANFIELQFKPGDLIKSPADGRSRLGYFISYGETRDEADSKAKRVKELVQVTYA